VNTSLQASELMLKRGGAVDPAKFLDETFDLLSIPAFDKGEPEVVLGRKIGSSKKCVQPGDVLLSRIIPHIRRCWVVPVERGRRQIASGEWIIFRGNEFYPDYLKHYLVSDGFHKKFMSTVSGVGGSLLRARPAEVERFEIPLPPFEEQRRIAAILDKADAIRRKRQRAIELTETFLRSVFLDMFGDPVTNPKGWGTTTLDSACLKITDGTHHSPKTLDTGIPYITAKHLKSYGLDFESSPWFVSEEDHVPIYKRCDPVKGDVLYIKDGATTGIAAINKYDFEFSMLSSLALLRTDQNILLSEYLCDWLNNDRVKERVIREVSGAAITRLTIRKIKDIRIELPPIDLQNEYRSIRQSAYLSLEKERRIFRKLEKLFSSLIQQAFKGELTQSTTPLKEAISA